MQSGHQLDQVWGYIDWLGSLIVRNKTRKFWAIYRQQFTKGAPAKHHLSLHYYHRCITPDATDANVELWTT